MIGGAFAGFHHMDEDAWFVVTAMKLGNRLSCYVGGKRIVPQSSSVWATVERPVKKPYVLDSAFVPCAIILYGPDENAPSGENPLQVSGLYVEVALTHVLYRTNRHAYLQGCRAHRRGMCAEVDSGLANTLFRAGDHLISAQDAAYLMFGDYIVLSPFDFEYQHGVVDVFV